MKNIWLLLILSVAVGTTCAWTMNYAQYGHREAYFGEITMDGTVNADNVMEKLKEYHSDSAAKAELDGDPVFDFGAMAPGTKGSHEFLIRNIGTEDLELELGASTCKCTLGDLKDTVLSPGESTSVTLEWTVKTDRNEFEQSAELRTNDPYNPAFRLVVRGLVIDELEFAPKKIVFGDVLSGEEFEFSTKMYSYYDVEIIPRSGQFGSEELTNYSEVSFEPFEPSEADGVHQRARQAFNVNVKVQPGVRQGPLVTTMEVSFEKTDKKIVESDDGDEQTPAVDEVAAAESENQSTDGDNQDGDSDNVYIAYAEVAGRIMGALSMRETVQIKSAGGGGYIWTLGRIAPDAPLEYRSLVSIKGSERGSTNLTIGETYPEGVIEANMRKLSSGGSTTLYQLTMTLKPGEEAIDLLGKNKEDFGWLWIESDNPKVSRMKVAVKTFLEPRP